jgi:hypothetical protein
VSILFIIFSFYYIHQREQLLARNVPEFVGYLCRPTSGNASDRVIEAALKPRTYLYVQPLCAHGGSKREPLCPWKVCRFRITMVRSTHSFAVHYVRHLSKPSMKSEMGDARRYRDLGAYPYMHF